MFFTVMRFLLGLSVLSAACASAADIEITAAFKPLPGQVLPQSFTNTTPLGGACASVPLICNRPGVASVAVPITFSNLGLFLRDQAGIILPISAGIVEVRHADGVSTERLELQLNGMGGTLSYTRNEVFTPQPLDSAQMSRDWDGSWAAAPPGCTALASQDRGTSIDFMWQIGSTGRCVKRSVSPLRSVSITNVMLSYVLTTPNPLAMKPGLYTGSITYTVGPLGVIGMGAPLQASDNSLTINVRLFVDALLKVEIPPGGHNVELVPPEGWARWADHGRAPSRLTRDQTFRIWANGSFNMRLECQNVQGDTCALRRSDGNDLVGLNVYAGLPGYVTDNAGRVVTRKRLAINSNDPVTVAPKRYMDGNAGVLTFEVPGPQVTEMLKKAESRTSGESTTYSGSVTVIWESVI